MVHFVGAGTGAPDLITVRGQRLIEKADVLIYTGSLINKELLLSARKECRKYDSAYMTLDEVIGVMEDAEAKGLETVRLHTGEPSIYGAVREQMDRLESLGISYDSCPGVSACFGAAADMNIEYTLPGVTQTLIITRMEGRTPVPEDESLEKLAAHNCSMAIYLSSGMLDKVQESLLAGGLKPDTPAAIVYKATWKDEKILKCTLKELYKTGEDNGIERLAVVLVGDAVKHASYDTSKLYDAGFSTGYRNENNMEKTAYLRRLFVIAFTDRGYELGWDIKDKLKDGLIDDIRVNRAAAGTLHDLTRSAWEAGFSLLFIGAVGIAVRAVAKLTDSKLTDRAVLAMDEEGKYVIPVLSGHAGGAADLARTIASYTGGTAVITSASDVRGIEAFDEWASENSFAILNKELIAPLYDRVLEGKKISVCCFDYEGDVPFENCRRIDVSDVKEVSDDISGEPPDIIIYGGSEACVIRELESRFFKTSLIMAFRYLTVGAGCRKGETADKIMECIRDACEKNGLDTRLIGRLSTIDIKRDEEGIRSICAINRWKLETYTAEELKAVEGEFEASEFVEKTVGVDNVCERAAVKAGGRLIVKKRIYDGVTAAVSAANSDRS